MFGCFVLYNSVACFYTIYVCALEFVGLASVWSVYCVFDLLIVYVVFLYLLVVDCCRLHLAGCVLLVVCYLVVVLCLFCWVGWFTYVMFYVWFGNVSLAYGGYLGIASCYVLLLLLYLDCWAWYCFGLIIVLFAMFDFCL